MALKVTPHNTALFLFFPAVVSRTKTTTGMKMSLPLLGIARIKSLNNLGCCMFSEVILNLEWKWIVKSSWPLCMNILKYYTNVSISLPFSLSRVHFPSQISLITSKWELLPHVHNADSLNTFHKTQHKYYSFMKTPITVGMLLSIITEYPIVEACQDTGALHKFTGLKQCALCGYSFSGTGLTVQ